MFHYTNKKGAEGIEKEKKIKASTDTTKDAAFGKGNIKYSGMNREQTEQLGRNILNTQSEKKLMP